MSCWNPQQLTDTHRCGSALSESMLIVFLTALLSLSLIALFSENMRALFAAADNGLIGVDSTPATRMARAPGSLVGLAGSRASAATAQAKKALMEEAERLARNRATVEKTLNNTRGRHSDWQLPANVPPRPGWRVIKTGAGGGPTAAERADRLYTATAHLLDLFVQARQGDGFYHHDLLPGSNRVRAKDAADASMRILASMSAVADEMHQREQGGTGPGGVELLRQALSHLRDGSWDSDKAQEALLDGPQWKANPVQLRRQDGNPSPVSPVELNQGWTKERSVWSMVAPDSFATRMFDDVVSDPMRKLLADYADGLVDERDLRIQAAYLLAQGVGDGYAPDRSAAAFLAHEVADALGLETEGWVRRAPDDMDEQRLENMVRHGMVDGYRRSPDGKFEVFKRHSISHHSQVLLQLFQTSKLDEFEPMHPDTRRILEKLAFEQNYLTLMAGHHESAWHQKRQKRSRVVENIVWTAAGIEAAIILWPLLQATMGPVATDAMALVGKSSLGPYWSAPAGAWKLVRLWKLYGFQGVPKIAYLDPLKEMVLPMAGWVALNWTGANPFLFIRETLELTTPVNTFLDQVERQVRLEDRNLLLLYDQNDAAIPTWANHILQYRFEPRVGPRATAEAKGFGNASDINQAIEEFAVDHGPIGTLVIFAHGAEGKSGQVVLDGGRKTLNPLHLKAVDPAHVLSGANIIWISCALGDQASDTRSAADFMTRANERLLPRGGTSWASGRILTFTEKSKSSRLEENTGIAFQNKVNLVRKFLGKPVDPVVVKAFETLPASE